MLGDDVRRIEISDLQNREGQHPLSAGPRAGYQRDWLIVWPLESARAHGGLTELGNADLPDTQIRALRGFDLRASTFGKTMPFFGNILPTLRSYSGIEYPQSHPPASFGRGEDRKSARTMGLGPRIHAGRGSAVAGRASADFCFRRDMSLQCAILGPDGATSRKRASAISGGSSSAPSRPLHRRRRCPPRWLC